MTSWPAPTPASSRTGDRSRLGPLRAHLSDDVLVVNGGRGPQLFDYFPDKKHFPSSGAPRRTPHVEGTRLSAEELLVSLVEQLSIRPLGPTRRQDHEVAAVQPLDAVFKQRPINLGQDVVANRHRVVR